MRYAGKKANLSPASAGTWAELGKKNKADPRNEDSLKNEDDPKI